MTAHLRHLPARLAPPKRFSRRRGIYRDRLKRVFDIAVVLPALPIVLPVVVLCALLVMTDGRPPFYRQRRLGRGGRVFTMLKLRSMVPDAERQLAELLRRDPIARAEWARHQKLRNYPRVTPVGAVIRRCSLDELPQLWNVLRGDMSLVGPRPMTPAQRNLYPGRAYFAMRPGITGFWQIGDRHNSSFATRAKYDTLYFKRLSLRTDLRVVFATAKAVMDGSGM